MPPSGRSKGESMQFQLAQILPLGFEYHIPRRMEDKVAFVIGRLAIFNPPTNQFRIGIQLSAHFANDPEKASFGSLEVHFVFKVTSEGQIAQETEEGDNDGIDKDLLISLFSVAYSTARGIWFAKGQGTLMGVQFPPVINPSEITLKCTIDNDPWGETSGE